MQFNGRGARFVGSIGAEDSRATNVGKCRKPNSNRSHAVVSIRIAVAQASIYFARREMKRKQPDGARARANLHIQLTQQLAVFLNNRPGTLARLCEALSEEKINIYAISTSDTVDHIVIRMVVSDAARALAIFEDRGTLALTTDVLMVDGSNKPGSLAAIANALAEAKINIEYAYCATHPTAQKGLLILRVSDPPKALKVLNS
jgi:hypothetical protein